VMDAVLVERSRGPINQREVTRLILESINPGAKLTYYSV